MCRGVWEGVKAWMVKGLPAFSRLGCNVLMPLLRGVTVFSHFSSSGLRLN